MPRRGKTPDQDGILSGLNFAKPSPAGPGWLEVSWQLDDELVEPAAELLGRVGANGVAIEPAGSKLLLRAWLHDDSDLEARLDRFRRGLWHLSQITPFPEPQYRHLAQDDWEAAWKREYRPLPIGRQLLVQPIVPKPDPEGMTNSSPWNDAFELIGVDRELSVDAQRTLLYLEPGMAFGTGTHPTTRQCLELLETYVMPGTAVLDVGCGSGILSIGAVLLGAGSALALDIDQDAVQWARTNVLHNRLGDRIRVELGSLEALPGGAPYALVLANIQAPTVIQLLREGMADFLAADGALIAAGILDEQQTEVERHAQEAGLTLGEVRAAGDWRALVLRQPPSAS